MTWEAVPLLDAMLEDEDESVLAAASATMHDLRFLDEDRWVATMQRALHHPAPVVRRNVVAGLRDYVEQRPEDPDGLLALAWSDGDEVVRTRLRELLLRMDEVAPEHLEQVLRRTEHGVEDLLASIDVRREGRGAAWRAYLSDEGPRPVALVAEPVRPEAHDMSEVPAPDLDDALDLLDDDLGFLD